MATEWDSHQALARAVIELAWRDAKKRGRGAYQAQEFLMTPSPLLWHWSSQAGVSYQWVMGQARKEFGDRR